MATIGDRALQRLKELSPPPKHRDVADSIGMTADAFSRALSGKRQFSSIELARLADQIDADLHWLITGELDPHGVSIAARHDFNRETGQRTTPTRRRDEKTLADIALVYRQAYSEPAKLVDWPKSPASVRAALGHGFISQFTDRLEKGLRVDVVRVAELSTELGHLTMGHHDDDLGPGDASQHEAAANAFAAELLLPAAELKAVAWDVIGDHELAALVWEWGVSVDALCGRLCALLGYAPNNVARWAAHPTQRLLRLHLRIESELDEITGRMDAASQRRFPLSVQEAHLERIASGAVSRATLAWMLGIDADSLDVDAPELPEANVDDLATALAVPFVRKCRTS
jgi:hypothetical protein